MSGGVSSGGLRRGNGGVGGPAGATMNGGAGALGRVAAGPGLTKPEADVYYVNVDGDVMDGPLALETATVGGNALAADPAADNALEWGEAGLYVPPVPTTTDLDPRYVNTDAAGDAMAGPLTIEGKAVDVSTGPGNLLTWDATGFYVAPTGADHSAAHDWYFAINTNVATDPGQGNLRANTGNLQTATTLAVDLVTNDNLDMSFVISTLVAGDVVLIQDKDVGANWVRYALNAPPTLQTGYWTFSVTRQAGAGTLTTAQLVAVVFWVQNPAGSTMDVTITGDNGIGVTESPANSFSLATRVSAGAGQGLTLAADGLFVQKAHDHTTADGSGVLSNDEHDGYSQYANLGADPTQPATNRIRLYSKDNGSGIATLYYRTEDGTIYELPTLTSGGNGSGAPANATYITTGSEAKLSAERVLGTAVIMSGLLSARPAAGTAGRLYLATDDATAYRDTGSAWEVFARSQPKVTVASSAPGSPATGDLWVW